MRRQRTTGAPRRDELSRRAIISSLALGTPATALLLAPSASAAGTGSVSLVTAPAAVGPGGLVTPWSVLVRDAAGARADAARLSFAVLEGNGRFTDGPPISVSGPDGLATAPGLRAGPDLGEVLVRITSDRGAALDVTIDVAVAPGDVLAWGAGVGPAPRAVVRADSSSVLVPGRGTALVVRADGSVLRWPSGASPPGGVPPEDPVPVVAVEWSGVAVLTSAGAITAALHRDGSISASEGGGAPSLLPPVTGATSVTASGRGLHVLDADGTVWAWGAPVGHAGRRTSTPRQVPGLHGVVDVVSGGSAVLALEADGEVWTWGEGSRDRLGPGDGTSAPLRLRLHDDVVALAAGRSSGYALTPEGRVWAWGDGRDGQLGCGDHRSSPSPRVVDGLPVVRAIAAGGSSAFAVDVEGAVWSWGRNDEGQLGDRTASTRTRPVRLPDLVGVQQVVSDGSTTHALC